MKFAYLACCIAVTVGVLAMCWYACNFLRASTSAIQVNSPQITAILGEVHHATQTANDAAASLKESADASRKYQTYILQHADNITHVTEEGLVHFNRYTLPAIDRAVADTSASINGRLIPEFSAESTQLATAGTSDLTRLGVLIDGLSGTNAQLQARISDPKIDILEDRFNVLALHLDNIAGNGEAMSGDMKLAVHRLAAPPSKFHQVLDVSWTAAKFGSLFIP